MPTAMSGLDRNLLSLALEVLLQTLRSRGYNPGKLKGREPASVIYDEFRARIEPDLMRLSFKTRSYEARQQYSLKLNVSKVRNDPRKNLGSLFQMKAKLVDRREVVGPFQVANLILYFACALAYRGFSGLYDKSFLDRLKTETEWLLTNLGYTLSSQKLCSCPHVIVWHEYDLWRRLCLADGIAKEALDEIIGHSSRVEVSCVGCHGYSVETEAQIDLSVVA